MSSKPTSWLKFRIFLVLFFFMISFMAIFARVFQLQVIMAPALKKLAEKQHQKVVLLNPKRGTIYDRNMKEMAVDLEVDSLFAHPQIVKKSTSAKGLAPILGLAVKSLKEKFYSDSPFVWIKRQLDPAAVEKIKELNLDGIGFIKERKRFYPSPSLAAHVIGFSGVDSQGLEGIELMYDNYLKGEGGYLIRERDALGSEIILRDLDLAGTTEAKDIVLTIDKTIQYIAEKELKKTVRKFNARAGIVVIMDPWTGEILAMANEPSFNPNFFRDSRPTFWRNRVVTDFFEPGSTFKVFLVAAALEEGSVKLGDILYGERGSYKVYSETIHDYKKFGNLSVAQVIKYSSNIGAIKIAERLGKKDFYRYIQTFGFGSRAGIDLPGESPGLVRDMRDWSKVSLATISFGQGISVTGIQLVTALSSIANGGYLVKPFVVKKILNNDGSVLKEFIPNIKRRVLSTETIRVMKAILRGVTEEDGTGATASFPGYIIAGKTGTAQKVDLVKGGYKDSYISSFMGFLPINNPGLSIFVAIDEPKGDFYGGQVAAPLFRDIARQVMPYLGILPDFVGTNHFEARVTDMKTKLAGVRRSDVEVRERDPTSIPDFEGKSLREVINEARELSLRLEINGSGRAVSQWPKAGNKVSNNKLLKVFFLPAAQ